MTFTQRTTFVNLKTVRDGLIFAITAGLLARMHESHTYTRCAFVRAHTDWGACRQGSSQKCTVAPVAAPGYSAGPLLRVSNGKEISKSTDPNSCPYGYKIWSPRNREDWNIVNKAMSVTDSGDTYPRDPDLIVDVTKPSDNVCSKENCEPMKSSHPKQQFQTSDGSAWWIRDATYDKKDGEYTANCYLNFDGLDPVGFDYKNCNVHSTSYLCQPIEKGT